MNSKEYWWLSKKSVERLSRINKKKHRSKKKRKRLYKAFEKELKTIYYGN